MRLHNSYTTCCNVNQFDLSTLQGVFTWSRTLPSFPLIYSWYNTASMLKWHGQQLPEVHHSICIRRCLPHHFHTLEVQPWILVVVANGSSIVYTNWVTVKCLLVKVLWKKPTKQYIFLSWYMCNYQKASKCVHGAIEYHCLKKAERHVTATKLSLTVWSSCMHSCRTSIIGIHAMKVITL